MERKQRFTELDSLRGLAALTVVFYHGLNLTVWNDHAHSQAVWEQLFRNSPLAIFNSGQQAVILFFVLSGFVLALPFLKGNPPAYSTFLTKRFFRLWTPYIVAVAFGFVVRSVLIQSQIHPAWGEAPTQRILLDHLLMIGMFSESPSDPVIWSLVHEMRISLIFPFMMYLILNSNWRYVLFNGLLLSLVGMTLHANFTQVDFFTNYFDSLTYILMFSVGAMLAKHREQLINSFKSLRPLPKGALVLVAFYFYAFPAKVTALIGGSTQFQYSLQAWFVTFATMIWILLALSGGVCSYLLTRGPLILLGKLSYSVYLYHIMLFYTFISLADKLHLSRIEIWALTFVLTFILATLSYKWVEKPSIQLGKWMVSHGFDPKRPSGSWVGGEK